MNYKQIVIKYFQDLKEKVLEFCMIDDENFLVETEWGMRYGHILSFGPIGYAVEITWQIDKGEN